MLPLTAEYEATLEAVTAMLADEDDLVANAANLAALLFERLEAVDWAGFYFLRGGELTLGPFQGRSAKSRVALGRGTAGRAIRDLRSIISDERLSDDSRDDDLTQAKLVVPLLLHGRAIGVLEVTSPFAGRFGEADRHGLEAAARAFVEGSDVLALIPRRASATKPSAVTAPAHDADVNAAVNGSPQSFLDDLAPPERPRQPPTTDRGAPMPTVTYASDPSPSTAERFDGFRADVRVRRAVVILLAGIFFVGALRLASGTGAGTIASLFAVFAIVGGFVARGWRLSVVRASFATAVYAALLILARAVSGEGADLPFNLTLIAAGLVGGYAGAVIARALSRRSQARHRAAAPRRP